MHYTYSSSNGVNGRGAPVVNGSKAMGRTRRMALLKLYKTPNVP
jgi:hypothetical protein